MHTHENMLKQSISTLGLSGCTTCVLGVPETSTAEQSVIHMCFLHIVKASNLFFSSFSSVSSLPLCGPSLSLWVCSFCSICQACLTAGWQWWILCVRSKHTRGSDKGKINNNANVLMEKEEKTRKRSRSRVCTKEKREEMTGEKVERQNSYTTGNKAFMVLNPAWSYLGNVLIN